MVKPGKQADSPLSHEKQLFHTLIHFHQAVATQHMNSTTTTIRSLHYGHGAKAVHTASTQPIWNTFSTKLQSSILARKNHNKINQFLCKFSLRTLLQTRIDTHTHTHTHTHTSGSLHVVGVVSGYQIIEVSDNRLALSIQWPRVQTAEQVHFTPSLTRCKHAQPPKPHACNRDTIPYC